MKTLLAIALAGIAGVFAQASAQAAPASLPEGFGAAPRHETTRAVWSTSSGESPVTLDRALVEHTCAMKRSIGATTHTPLFEAGTDRPNTVTIVHVTSPQAWASYETIRGAVCDPSTTDATHDLCSCTFREMTSRFIHIHKSQDGMSETIDVDLAKGTATRRLHKAAPAHSMAPADAGVFGPVVGHDTIAGMPCSVHRQDLGTGRTERCLADAVDSVPAPLQMQELSKTMYLLGGEGAVRRDWRRTDRVDADAEIDTGVFEVPAGITLRTVGSPASRP
jgi:hypothetical protein